MHFVKAVLATLDSVHSHGLVHGDVRSENVVLEGEDRGWLIDFNAAHRCTDPLEQKAERAELRRILGTIQG